MAWENRNPVVLFFLNICNALAFLWPVIIDPWSCLLRLGFSGIDLQVEVCVKVIGLAWKITRWALNKFRNIHAKLGFQEGTCWRLFDGPLLEGQPDLILETPTFCFTLSWHVLKQIRWNIPKPPCFGNQINCCRTSQTTNLAICIKCSYRKGNMIRWTLCKRCFKKWRCHFCMQKLKGVSQGSLENKNKKIKHQ